MLFTLSEDIAFPRHVPAQAAYHALPRSRRYAASGHERCFVFRLSRSGNIDTQPAPRLVPKRLTRLAVYLLVMCGKYKTSGRERAPTPASVSRAGTVGGVRAFARHFIIQIERISMA